MKVAVVHAEPTWLSPAVHPRLALLGRSLLALWGFASFAIASPAFAEQGSLGANLAFGGGLAAFQEQGRGRAGAGGVALTLRAEDEIAARTDLALTFTWGLTDWARAKEYIQAGNRAAQWTTDRLANVESWATKDVPKNQQVIRPLGAFFADVFLLLTYVAVPACYVASPLGATSYLQLDLTGTYRFADGPTFPYLELGGGVATLPYRDDWQNAYGPVLGLGFELAGKVRIGARALYSAPGWNRGSLPGSVLLGALIFSTAR